MGMKQHPFFGGADFATVDEIPQTQEQSVESAAEEAHDPETALAFIEYTFEKFEKR
ncbi:hypothetical protein OQA88_6898 [Cercophora sp. LCS_1]